MVFRITLRGRRYYIINFYTRFVFGIIFLLLGVILWLVEKNQILLIFSIMGIISLLSSWYMWRKAHNPNLKDVQIG